MVKKVGFLDFRKEMIESEQSFLPAFQEIIELVLFVCSFSVITRGGGAIALVLVVVVSCSTSV